MTWQVAINDALIALIPIATTLILKVVVPELFAYLGAHVAWLKKSSAFQTARELVASEVTAAAQTTVNVLKAQGKWSQETAAALKASVLKNVLQNLPTDEKKVLASAVGDLSGYIGNLIESQVATNKATGVQATVQKLANPPSASPSAASGTPASA